MEKKSNTKLVECKGTRYYRLVILTEGSEPKCLITAFLQTPLVPAEIQLFVTNRVGSGYKVIATELTKEEAVGSDEKTAIIPLCNLESLLKSYVPEVVVEVTYAKITRTNKGTRLQHPVDPKTGEAIEK